MKLNSKKILKNAEIMRIMIFMSCALALIAAALSWWQITSVSHNYSAALERAQKFNTIKLILTTEHLIGNERGYTNEYLLSTASNEQNAKNALQINRRKTDASLSQIREIPELIPELNNFENELDRARHSIDAVMNDAKRSPEDIKDNLDVSLKSTDVFNQLMINTIVGYASSDVTVAGYFYNLLALGEIRDTLGRMATPYIYSLRFDKPLTAKDISLTTKRETRLSLLWTLLDGLKYNKDLSGDLLTAKRDYNTKINYLVDTSDDESSDNVSRPKDIDLFLIQYREGLSSFYSLESHYLDHLNGIFHTQTTSSLSQLITVIVSLLVLLCIIITICAFINIKVLNPLLMLNQTVRNVIGGNIHASKLSAGGAAEIQCLFQSIDILDDAFKEQKAEAKDLTRKINEDPLTGLNNRRGFDELSKTMLTGMQKNQIKWLAMIDIDHFKSINDTWGHPFGDKVLVGLGRALQSTCRESDFVARLGGEEFVMVFHADSETQAKKALARFQENIRALRFTTAEDETVAITASFGAVQVDDSPVEELLKSADSALYQAKKSGRDRICWA
ncbi:GGDEF domain-containing protein [Enterobacteriaceae bacterium 89]|nr:GGDEF domain-containing protein [Enterobacteriaceae bacterium 89]